MYFTTHAYSDNGRAYYETDLIEAEGEAENLFLEEVTRNQYVEQNFTAIDEVSEYEIGLDIVDYIGQKAYNTFESIANNTEEYADLSYTKLDSWYKACKVAKR